MNHPKPATREELASMLEEMAALVRYDDSLEGHIEYQLPDPDAPSGTYAMVRAAYRLGNRDHGQGYMRFWGSLTPPEAPEDESSESDWDGVSTF